MMSGQFMMIDNMPVEINGEKNLLELIRKTGTTAERLFVQSSGMATARTGEPSAFLKRRGSVA